MTERWCGKHWYLRGLMSGSLAALLAATTLQPPPAGAQPTQPACTVTAANAATPGAGVIEIEIGTAQPAAATPSALPMASPVATPVAETDALAEEITSTAEQLAACLSENEAAAVVQLASERYLGQLFGSSVPLSVDDFLAISQSISPTPVRIVSVEDVARTAEDRATATVTQVVGSQLIEATWTFKPSRTGTGWMVDAEQRLPTTVPAGADTIAVAIDNLSFAVEPASVEGSDVVLRGENRDNLDHEMLVLKLEPGFTTQDLLRAAGPDLPPQATYIGEVPVRAGHEQDLVLVDLEPGVYTIVCLFPNSDGVPHLAQGMAATFTVE
ncbi:MAG: hypothetical protein KC442_14235 [Thermomicrobiales bacterium]|nr:hypothetical protein [Thermomicrobiales bacterium]